MFVDVIAQSRRVLERDGLEGFDRWWALLGETIWLTLRGPRRIVKRAALPPIEPPY